MYQMAFVNGARGEVVDIVTNSDRTVTSVLVKFDNPQVGLKAIQTSPYRTQFPNAVPLAKYEVMFIVKGRRGSEVTRFAVSIDISLDNHHTQSARTDT